MIGIHRHEWNTEAVIGVDPQAEIAWCRICGGLRRLLYKDGKLAVRVFKYPPDGRGKP